MTLKLRPIESITRYFRAKPLRIVLTVLWGLFVSLIITLGFKPDPYLLQVQGIPAPHPYPLDLVVELVFFMTLHLALIVTFDVYIRSRWKFIMMLITTTLFLLIFGMMSMHAPPPLGAFVMWQALSFLVLLLLCIWQAGLFFYSKYNVKNKYN